DPQASAEVFRDGWFYPGDTGMLTADGRLKILGRIKDQFNLGGIKVNAEEIDTAAGSVPGIREAMCFTTPAATGLLQLSICAVRDPNADPAAAAASIRAVCKANVRQQLNVP